MLLAFIIYIHICERPKQLCFILFQKWAPNCVAEPAARRPPGRPAGAGPMGPTEVYGLLFCWPHYGGSGRFFRTLTYIYICIYIEIYTYIRNVVYLLSSPPLFQSCLACLSRPGSTQDSSPGWSESVGSGDQSPELAYSGHPSPSPPRAKKRGKASVSQNPNRFS